MSTERNRSASSFSLFTHHTPRLSRPDSSRPVWHPILRLRPVALLCLGVTVFLCVSAWAQQTMKLIIDGKTAASAPMVVQGKTYIPLEALKAAGVHVKASDKTIELTLPSRPSAEGGANQQAGVEGKGGEWLFNGIWRFRVLTIEKADPEKVGTGWMVKVEIRNGSKFNDIAPAGTGWQGISLVTEDGNSLPAASDAVDLRDMGLAQGAGNTQNIFFQSDSTSKPIRLILRLTPKGLEGLPASLRYSTPDPSFRVDIKNLLMPPPFLEI